MVISRPGQLPATPADTEQKKRQKPHLDSKVLDEFRFVLSYFYVLTIESHPVAVETGDRQVRQSGRTAFGACP